MAEERAQRRLAAIEAAQIPHMRLAAEARTSKKARGQELESALSVKNPPRA